MRTLCLGLLVFGLPAAAQTATEAAYLSDATGLWSSESQSASDAYDWVLSEKWPIMTEHEDGVWVYQENTIYGSDPQAAPEAMPAPYFQVVIHLRDLGDGLLHTTTYRLKDRAAARRFAQELEPDFDANWLGEIACMGEMQRVGEGFWNGSATCPNGYKGGVKVESRSTRAPEIYVNWDRGFDAAGEHIWGPADGGYIFKRVEEAP